MLGKKLEITIHNLGNNGEGVGKYENFTLFVSGALPGERVVAEVFEKHKSYGRARLLKVVNSAVDRVEAPCPLFGKCGGCQLMHLSYPQQLLMKRQRVVDALARIGKITEVEVAPCQPSPSPVGYRNKIQLPVRNKDGALSFGLYAPSSHDLVEVDHCLIHSPLGEEVYSRVAAILKSSQITAYDPTKGSGLLRHLLIKSAVTTKEALVILVTYGEGPKALLRDVANAMVSSTPYLRGVVQNLNSGNDNVILGERFLTLAGQPTIQEKLGSLTFQIAAPSFFQVNSEQALVLYRDAVASAGLSGVETVIDAYCGVGTLSLFFAPHVQRVVGVECVAAAIDNARANAHLNGIDNVSFVCDDAEKYIESIDSVDVVVLNPPRKGCASSLLERLGSLLPRKIVYISCDPATLARDAAILAPFGYKVAAVRPYDMFPQTAHVETLCLLLLGDDESVVTSTGLIAADDVVDGS